MFDGSNIQQDVYDFLLEYATTSDNVNYCDNCPYLRHEEDTGAYDCEYGGDIESCEYSPSDEIQRIAEKFREAIVTCKP